MAHAAGGVEELIEGLDLFGAEIGDQGVGGLLARAGTSALLARSMVEMDGSKIRASRRAVTTPIAIVIPLSVAHAVLAAASTMKGISARVGPRSPKRAASSRA
jgi:hypothetical protein